MRKLRKAVPPVRWRKLYFASLALALATLAAAAALDWNPVAVCAGVGILVLGQLSGLVFWRCPTCDRVLPLRGLIGMEHCPYCSYSLRDKLEY